MQARLENTVHAMVRVAVACSPLAVPRTRDVQIFDTKFAEKFQSQTSGLRTVQAMGIDQKRGPFMLAAIVCREGCAASHYLSVDDQCAVTVDDVGKCALGIIRTGVFRERIAVVYGSILSLAAFRTVATAREPVMQCNIQCSPVDTGLATRNDFLKRIRAA